jgi:hypothetical protein
VLTPHGVLAEQRRGQEPSTGVDLVWRPAATDELRLVDGSGDALVVLRRDGDRVTAGSGTDMPVGGGDLRVVLDGPVLEVAGRAGLLAVPVPGVPGPVRPVGGDLDWWALEV